jgi:hypothetical protein
MAAIPNGIIDTAIPLGNRRGTIGTIIITHHGLCFRIGRSGRNGKVLP